MTSVLDHDVLELTTGLDPKPVLEIGIAEVSRMLGVGILLGHDIVKRLQISVHEFSYAIDLIGKFQETDPVRDSI